MIKKRLAIIFLAVTMVLSLAGCKPTDNNPGGPGGPGVDDPPAKVYTDYTIAPTGAPDYSAHSGEQMVIGAYIGYSRNYSTNKERYDTYPRYAAEAGVNTIFGIRAAQVASSKNIERMLAAMEPYGVKALVSMQGLSYPNDVEDYIGKGESSPSFMGYDFWDEPGVTRFMSLQNQAKEFLEKYPTKNAFINMLPSYATLGQLEAESYDDYLGKFTRNVKSVSQICVDHYPLIGEMYGDVAGSSTLSKTWLYDLEANANAAKSAGKDFWCYIQGMAYGNRRIPESAACLKFQNYVSMCYGVKSVSYFCLDTPAEGVEFDEYVYGMIDRDGNKTPIHGYAKEANEELAFLDHVYLQFDWDGCMPVKGTADGTNIAFVNLRTPVTESEYFGVEADHDALVGIFTDKSGYKGYLITPYADTHLDYISEEFIALDTELAFTFNADKLLVLDMKTKQSSVVDLTDGKYEITLSPGDGQFVIPFNSAQ